MSELTLEATATAWIEFVIAVNAECAAAGDASVCTVLYASLRDYAAAWARITLDAWAGAFSGCGCAMVAEDYTEVLRDVLVAGTLDAWGGFCLGAPRSRPLLHARRNRRRRDAWSACVDQLSRACPRPASTSLLASLGCCRSYRSGHC